MNSKAKRRRAHLDQLLYTKAVLGAPLRSVKLQGRTAWFDEDKEVTNSVNRLMAARRLGYGEIVIVNGPGDTDVTWTLSSPPNMTLWRDSAASLKLLSGR